MAAKQQYFLDIVAEPEIVEPLIRMTSLNTEKFGTNLEWLRAAKGGRNRGGCGRIMRVRVESANAVQREAIKKGFDHSMGAQFRQCIAEIERKAENNAEMTVRESTTLGKFKWVMSRGAVLEELSMVLGYEKDLKGFMRLFKERRWTGDVAAMRLWKKYVEELKREAARQSLEMMRIERFDHKVTDALTAVIPFTKNAAVLFRAMNMARGAAVDDGTLYKAGLAAGGRICDKMAKGLKRFEGRTQSEDGKGSFARVMGTATRVMQAMLWRDSRGLRRRLKEAREAREEIEMKPLAAVALGYGNGAKGIPRNKRLLAIAYVLIGEVCCCPTELNCARLIGDGGECIS